MTKTVIIGGVAAGASCAARLRRLDESAEIVMLEKGPYVSFANCGLPYFVGGVIRDRSDLSVQTPERLKSRFRIDVRTESEALSIDRAAKTVRVRGADGREYDEPYDRLVIATGASPIVPDIPGIRLKRVRTLTTVDDAVGLRSLVSVHRFMSAAVIGGGFIGLEAAENLREAGCSVTLIEASPQIMPPLDPEMAEVLTGELRRNGVELLTGTAAEEFQERDDGGLLIRLSGGRTVEADLAVLAIGVRPNSAIARDAGLEIGKTGGIAVSPELVTSDPDIYAAGDVIDVTDFISGEKTSIPLAGPANRQGRIAANNIALGNHEAYKGTQGSSVAKVFGLTAAKRYDETRREPFLDFSVRGKCAIDVSMNMPGEFNMYNALPCIALADQLGIPHAAIQSALSHLRIRARYEMVFDNGHIRVCVDYAHNGYSMLHHLEGLREYQPKRLICVYSADGV